MSQYIGKYVSTCDLCLRTKPQRHLPTGELHPLPIPDAPWDTVSMDFIVELPESSGHDAIMVVVDSFTKRAHFVPTFTTLSAAGTSRLFVQHVWKLHSIPRKVVSDQGPQFVAEFTRELYHILGIKIAATTAYHPQGDGQRNGSIKNWSNTFGYSSTNDRTTGQTSSLWQNSSITTISICLLSNLPSSLNTGNSPGWVSNQTNTRLG